MHAKRVENGEHFLWNFVLISICGLFYVFHRLTKVKISAKFVVEAFHFYLKRVRKHIYFWYLAGTKLND